MELYVVIVHVKGILRMYNCSVRRARYLGIFNKGLVKSTQVSIYEYN